MLPDQAERIVMLFGECLEKQRLTQLQHLDTELNNISRDELRKAVLIFIAKKKYEGDDLNFRHILESGERVATLELVDHIWNFIPFFGVLRTEIPDIESNEKIKETDIKYDEFIVFLSSLSPKDLDYWEKVYDKIVW